MNNKPTMLRHLAFSLLAGTFLTACAIGPDYSQYEWRKSGGTTDERDRLRAAAQVEAIKAYPDPMSRAQINAEPINAPMVRQVKRNEVITNYMASHGWRLVQKTSE